MSSLYFYFENKKEIVVGWSNWDNTLDISNQELGIKPDLHYVYKTCLLYVCLFIFLYMFFTGDCLCCNLKYIQ